MLTFPLSRCVNCYARLVLKNASEAVIIFSPRVEDILNLQPKQGKAKAYQIKQLRAVILNYQLGGQDED